MHNYDNVVELGDALQNRAVRPFLIVENKYWFGKFQNRLFAEESFSAYRLVR